MLARRQEKGAEVLFQLTKNQGFSPKVRHLLCSFGLTSILVASPFVAVSAVEFTAVGTSQMVTKVKPNSKCVKRGSTAVVKGKKFVCTKVKKGLVWRPVKVARPAIEELPKPVASETLSRPSTITIVPDGRQNAQLVINQRFLPEIAQSFTINETISLESIAVSPSCITYVPLNYYSGMDQDHSLESFPCNYPDFDTTVTLSLYKLNSTFNGNPSSFRISALPRVSVSTVSTKIKLGSDLSIPLDAPALLDPGFYVAVLGFVLTDPNINTVWFRAHQYNTAPYPACVTNPQADVYEMGSAYRGEPSQPYTGLANNFRGTSDLFVMHQAKVQSCIVIGNFSDDVFAFGDLEMKLDYRTP